MADLTDGDSDLRKEDVKKEEEKPCAELKTEIDADEVGPTVGPEDSEYETLEEDNDGDDSPRRDAEYKEEFDEDRSESEGSRRDDDSEGSLSGEETDQESKDAEVGQRQEGDGQESNKDKKLDHDEDRRDPQYIPKKGIFYEHDDRTNDDLEEEGETKTEDTTAKKGRVWKEPTDKWEHDMFNEGEQAPKSTQELLDLYGYDIRNEDSAPKARRRRRYGRGPTKYTRNWEDETAYSKKRGGGRGGGFVNRKEDFPSLEAPPGSGSGPVRGGRSPRGRGKPRSEDWSPPRTLHINSKMRGEKSEAMASPLNDSRNERIQGRGRSAPRRTEGRGRPSQHERATTKPSTPPFKPKGETDEEDIAALSKQFSDAVINIARDGTTSLPIRGSSAPPSDKPASGVVESHQQLPQQHQQVQQQQSQQGRSGSEGAEGAGGRSKRYSTQRQRSLPQPTVQQQYIQQQQQYFQQQPPQIHSGFPAAGRGVYPGEEAPAMVAFLPPGGGPPTYPPPPPPPAAIINYVPSPHQFHHAPIPMPPPPAGPAEVYTGQGGITYYSTQNQLARPSNVSRRVKLAIPIVPPPDQQSHDTLTT